MVVVGAVLGFSLSGRGRVATSAVAITADEIEDHLRKVGFEVPASGTQASFVGGDGVMSYGFIPRPFGAPKDDASETAGTQYSYECKRKDGGGTIRAKIEANTGRFLFFASSDEADATAMRALLQHIDPVLPGKCAALARDGATRTGSKAPSATLRGAMLRVTAMGTILTSEKLPVVFGSEAPAYGLSDDGQTPLMIAAGNLQADKVMALLKKGADPKARAKGGYTALHFLCDSSHGYMSENFGKIADALIKHGADANAKSDDGEVPLDLAHTTTDGEMAKFMRDHGAKWR